MAFTEAGEGLGKVSRSRWGGLNLIFFFFNAAAVWFCLINGGEKRWWASEARWLKAPLATKMIHGHVTGENRTRIKSLSFLGCVFSLCYLGLVYEFAS